MKNKGRLLSLLLTLTALLSLLCGCFAPGIPGELSGPAQEVQQTGPDLPDEEGSYTGAEELALYIRCYGHLPPNFITKSEARELGWQGGSLEAVAPGMCIGGDRFGNREGLLPEAPGRSWKECDVDTLGSDSRGARRLVFSNDGLIYYTGDHYGSFTRLY